MQYLLLIYGNEEEETRIEPQLVSKLMQEFGEFTAFIKQSGHHQGGGRLHPVSTATTVRIRDGKTMITDGPFAETREQLGGFYLVEATDLDAAVALAARIPSARFGSVEVRPIWPTRE